MQRTNEEVKALLTPTLALRLTGNQFTSKQLCQILGTIDDAAWEALRVRQKKTWKPLDAAHLYRRYQDLCAEVASNMSHADRGLIHEAPCDDLDLWQSIAVWGAPWMSNPCPVIPRLFTATAPSAIMVALARQQTKRHTPGPRPPSPKRREGDRAQTTQWTREPILTPGNEDPRWREYFGSLQIAKPPTQTGVDQLVAIMGWMAQVRTEESQQFATQAVHRRRTDTLQAQKSKRLVIEDVPLVWAELARVQPPSHGIAAIETDTDGRLLTDTARWIVHHATTMGWIVTTQTGDVQGTMVDHAQEGAPPLHQIPDHVRPALERGQHLARPTRPQQTGAMLKTLGAMEGTPNRQGWPEGPLWTLTQTLLEDAGTLVNRLQSRHAPHFKETMKALQS